MNPFNPRIKIHANKQATLSGLNYDDLRSILTAASIRFYESLDKAKKKKDIEDIEWYQHMLKLMDCTRASMDMAIRNTYLERPTTLTKKQRLAKVIEERKERLLVQEILSDILHYYMRPVDKSPQER